MCTGAKAPKRFAGGCDAGDTGCGGAGLEDLENMGGGDAGGVPARLQWRLDVYVEDNGEENEHKHDGMQEKQDEKYKVEDEEVAEDGVEDKEEDEDEEVDDEAHGGVEHAFESGGGFAAVSKRPRFLFHVGDLARDANNKSYTCAFQTCMLDTPLRLLKSSFVELFGLFLFFNLAKNRNPYCAFSHSFFVVH